MKSVRRRPNILFVHADSIDGRALGCQGHPAAHTPNADRLASRGLRYANAYCPSPVCLPSRVATWAGQHVHRQQAWSNAAGVTSNAQTFLPRLRHAGYETWAIGRDDRFAGAHSLPHRLAVWTRSSGVVLTRRDMTPRAVLADDRQQRVREPDWRHTDKAIEFLDRHRNADRPFFLSLGYINPHPGGGYRTSPHYLEKIAPAKVALPNPDREEHPVMRYMRIAKNCDVQGGDEEILRIRRHYLAMVAEIDQQLGLILDRLEANGLAENTVVIFFSDHGDMQMEHGQWRKSSMFESSARVPLILAGPGVPRGEARQGLASLLDLYPTLLELAGAPADPDTDGVSLLRPETERPNHAIAQYHDSLQNTGSYMFRRGPWKLIEYVGFAPQLFNVEEDPDELDDRADRERDILQALRQGLREQIDVESVDAQAKAQDVESLVRLRKLIGEQAFRKLIEDTFVDVSADDLLALDQWMTRDGGFEHPAGFPET